MPLQLLDTSFAKGYYHDRRYYSHLPAQSSHASEPLTLDSEALVSLPVNTLTPSEACFVLFFFFFVLFLFGRQLVSFDIRINDRNSLLSQQIKERHSLLAQQILTGVSPTLHPHRSSNTLSFCFLPSSSFSLLFHHVKVRKVMYVFHYQVLICRTFLRELSLNTFYF